MMTHELRITNEDPAVKSGIKEDMTKFMTNLQD